MIPRPAILLLGLALAGCGSSASASETAGDPPDAVTIDNTFHLQDIGATRIGMLVRMPSAVEYQLAGVVIRDGKFSPKESWLSRSRMLAGERDSFALMAFQAHGPLRPDADDALLYFERLGMCLHIPSPWVPMPTQHPPNILVPNAPFIEVASMTWGTGNVSTDIRHPDHVVGAIHLFIRVLDITATTPANGDAKMDKITSLDQILPPEPSATGAAAP